MRKQVIACDRCGRNEKMGSKSESFRVLKFTKAANFNSQEVEAIKDLCGACAHDVRGFINTPPV